MGEIDAQGAGGGGTTEANTFNVPLSVKIDRFVDATQIVFCDETDISMR